MTDLLCTDYSSAMLWFCWSYKQRPRGSNHCCKSYYQSHRPQCIHRYIIESRRSADDSTHPLRKFYRRDNMCSCIRDLQKKTTPAVCIIEANVYTLSPCAVNALSSSGGLEQPSPMFPFRRHIS